MKRNVSVVCVCFVAISSLVLALLKKCRGLVGSGTPYITASSMRFPLPRPFPLPIPPLTPPLPTPFPLPTFFNVDSIVFVNNQLDAQFFFMYVYFYSLHVSGSHVPITRRINCINKSHPNLYTRRSSIQSDIYQMSY